jgi:soluble epoxide hydrolase/lipid-phosphate phosphatase
MLHTNAGLSADLRSDLPYLLIWGTKDATALPRAITNSRNYIPRYQDIALEGRGCWLMVEAKDEITESIIKWLEELTFTRSQSLEKL